MQEKILVIDDEREIADLVEIYLQNENYSVYKFYSSEAAMEHINKTKFDLAVLDIMLPDIDGFKLLNIIRNKFNYPVIMLTAKDEDVDKITGLTLGADDYIVKPFRPLEVVARVKAQLRRYKKYNPAYISEQQNYTISHLDLTMNTKTHECFINDEEIVLTPTEFTILRILLENKGDVISAEDLFHRIWKDEYYNKNNNTITVHIRHLREKLHDTVEKPKYIKTIWGVGYKIEK